MPLKFYEDVITARPLIEKAIQKFGYAPEHNFDWYRFCTEDDEKNIFIMDDYGCGLFTMVNKHGEYRVFSSPVADSARRISILVEYLEQIFQTLDVKKVWLELEASLRKEFLKVLPSHLKSNSINYTLTWPIMDMKTFDLALPGGHYKYLRKEKHKFYRDHVVTVTDAKNFEDKNSLYAIIDSWKKKRKTRDRAWCTEYNNMINGNFDGMATARVFIVDGKAAGINAGWMIPNSDRFYGAIGIHDYSVPDLGAMLYLEDLEWLKNHGYWEVDMGGGEKALTAFKNFFLPKSFYKTNVFSVVKT